MRIVLRKSYSTYLAGTAIDCDDDVALRLIEGGIAHDSTAPQPVETATVDYAAETADVTPRRVERHAKDK